MLGWDPVKKEGTFTGDFRTTITARPSRSALDEGADIYLGVGGAVGQGSFAAVQETGITGDGIGVNVD